MTPEDHHVATELKIRLDRAAPRALRRLIVFGSRVREQATPESDLDVVALVDELTTDLEQRLDDAAYALMWDLDFQPIISLKVFEENWFETALHDGLPFCRNVAREGLVVI
ncbi:MAG: nucleotidyltransferase domain-containing protein [Magnetococcales bacterium]|nr:nucleotidyltransferase domain-containing protein [Magnetococcales bacterium]